MNPQQDPIPGLPLPQPSFDAAPTPAGMPGAYAPQPQQQGMGVPPAAPAGFGGAPLPQAQTVQPPMPGVSQPQQQTPMPSAMPMSTDVAASAQPEDETALDQEWVTKAREIVLRTHSDPYLQSKELSKIKAQYIKVRYNKDIKTVEE